MAMTRRISIALFSLNLSQPALGQVAAPATSAAPTTAGPTAPAVQFGFDDLMTLLIQPRHLKLYYAGTQRNWELAAAELRDLRSGLDLIAKTYPKYLNNPVQDALASMMAPSLQELEGAIAAADPAKFTLRYRELTGACNACHTYMEHPYIVVAVPQAPAKTTYPSQDFRSTP